MFMLLGFIACCFLAALTGALFRPGEWYERLAKPSWRPPNRLFGPVWTVLYLTIAVSGWLVWREAGFAGAVLPLTIYALKLVLNAAWTRRRIGAAFSRMARTSARGFPALMAACASCSMARSAAISVAVALMKAS